MTTRTRSRSPDGRPVPLVAPFVILVAFECGQQLPTVPTTDHLGPLSVRGGVDVAESFPVQLTFSLEFENREDFQVRLLTDGCGVLPRAYESPEREGDPVWDTRPEGLSREPCRGPPSPAVVVPAGGSLRLTRQYGAGEVLGDSLPDGRYYFSVTYRASLENSEEVRLLEVTAGDARLDVLR